MSKWLPLSCFFIAALLLASCVRTGRQSPTAAQKNLSSVPAAQEKTLSAPGQAPPAAANPLPPPGAAHPPHPPAAAAAPLPHGITLQPQQPSAAQRGPANAAGLMALGRERRIMPEDFKIGPLGDNRTVQQDQKRALEAASAFLDHLVAGSVDKDLLTSESQDAVADTLAFGLRQGNTPTAYRLGSPKARDDGEISAAVRLFGSQGTSEGVIYVAPSGSLWLVADLQLSLAQLSVKREKPKEKFFPLEYRWLLEE